jgi:hypothetical protein
MENLNLNIRLISYHLGIRSRLGCGNSKLSFWKISKNWKCSNDLDLSRWSWPWINLSLCQLISRHGISREKLGFSNSGIFYAGCHGKGQYLKTLNIAEVAPSKCRAYFKDINRERKNAYYTLSGIIDYFCMASCSEESNFSWDGEMCDLAIRYLSINKIGWNHWRRPDMTTVFV